MLKSILQAAVTSAQQKQGFSLIELKDHILELLLKGSRVAVFSQYSATVLGIRAEADRAAQQIK